MIDDEIVIRGGEAHSEEPKAGSENVGTHAQTYTHHSFTHIIICHTHTHTYMYMSHTHTHSQSCHVGVHNCTQSQLHTHRQMMGSIAALPVGNTPHLVIKGGLASF
eukprot:GHVU01020841.1.p1 GENE.GHVU01020841.1~~GHVU01020841.1.p1  ORF type:complete len:106 (-),score=7.73 GHVU01020841.1:70-387(-)